MTDSEIKITSGQEWVDARDAGAPEHYSYGEAEIVAKVQHNGRTAVVVVVGEMRYRVVADDEPIRNASGLRDYGITTDEQLEKALLFEELICENNPWYEVWVNDEYSEPCWSQGECLAQAEEMLKHPLDTHSSL